MKRFWKKVHRPSLLECWPWQGATFRSGYGAFKYKGKTIRAHRMAYELRVGPLEEGKVIMHLCNNKLCCNPDHLYQGTPSENLQHAGSYGLMTREVGANSKLCLSDEVIHDIMTSHLSDRALARKYGIGCHKTISRIRRANQQ